MPTRPLRFHAPSGADCRQTLASPLDDLIDTASERLSRAELRVAQVVRAQPYDVARLSISALATLSFTSDPTVVRFCHQLGFASFRQFKEFLSCHAGSADLRLDDGVDIKDALADIVCEMVRNRAWNLLQLRHRLVNNSMLTEVVERLAVAHELHVCGSGRSTAVVEHGRSVFAESGGSAHAHVDPAQFSSLVPRLHGASVIVAVWDGPPDEALQALVGTARLHKLPVLGIAADEDRLTAECDWALSVGPEVAPARSMPTLVAQSTMLDALARCTHACRLRSTLAAGRDAKSRGGGADRAAVQAPRLAARHHAGTFIELAPAQAFGATSLHPRHPAGSDRPKETL